MKVSVATTIVAIACILASTIPASDVAYAQAACAEKNRDYCEADETCIWDSQLATCGAASCSQYQDHSYCTADPNDAGPCSWDWRLRVCYQRNGEIPCSAFFEDCPTERCSFNTDLGVCYPKDGSPPCYSFIDQAACNSAPGCTFVENSCYAVGEATACSIHYSKSDCPSGCTFHDFAQICYPSDLEIPCRLYGSDDNECPTDRCRSAPVGQDITVCVNKNTVIPCSEYFEASYCPETRCMFNQNAHRCFDPEIGLDCDSFTSKETCPADKCRYVNGLCLDQEQPMDCSIFYYGDASCGKANECRPDCENSICVSCPTDGSDCDDTPCSGVEPVDPSNCEEHITEPICSGDPNCVWNNEIDACVDTHIGTPCSDYLEESQCSDLPDCRWDGGECVSCTGADCNPFTTTATPDTGADCSTYDSDTCPFPRCIFHFAAGSKEGTCAEATCRDLYDRSICEGKDGCSFNTEAYVCYDTADGPPCNYFASQSSCKNYNTCQWDSDSFQCYGKDTSKDCSKYKSSNCPKRCSIQYETDSCVDKSCREFYQKADCVGAGCTYDDSSSICYKDTGKQCNKYTAFDDCPPNRCAFHWNNQGTGGTCSDRACVDAYNEEDCKSIQGCSYLASINLCYKDTGKQCESYKKYENCPQNRCSWFSQNGKDFVCASKVCSDFYDGDMCKSAGCDWDPASYSCFNDTHLSCDKYDQRTCPTNRCVYDWNFGLCRTYSCADYLDKSSCLESTLSCDFSDQYSVCYTKGEQIPCGVFNYNPTLCPKDRCQFASDVKICYPQGGKVPCGVIYDKSPCQTRDYCKWNSNDFRCVPSS